MNNKKSLANLLIALLTVSIMACDLDSPNGIFTSTDDYAIMENRETPANKIPENTKIILSNQLLYPYF